MTREIVIKALLSKQTEGSVHERMNEPAYENPDQANIKRLRFLALLKSRYGYTNDKAVDELKRLLRQFSITNQSLGTQRPRLILKRPHAE